MIYSTRVKGEWENEHDFSFIVFICIISEYLLQLDKRWSINLWVVASKLALFLLLISFVEFYECIFVANGINFEIFETVVEIRF